MDKYGKNLSSVGDESLRIKPFMQTQYYRNKSIKKSFDSIVNLYIQHLICILYTITRAISILLITIQYKQYMFNAL